jgi:hypothetical protein
MRFEYNVSSNYDQFTLPKSFLLFSKMINVFSLLHKLVVSSAKKCLYKFHICKV